MKSSENAHLYDWSFRVHTLTFSEGLTEATLGILLPGDTRCARCVCKSKDVVLHNLSARTPCTPHAAGRTPVQTSNLTYSPHPGFPTVPVMFELTSPPKCGCSSEASPRVGGPEQSSGQGELGRVRVVGAGAVPSGKKCQIWVRHKNQEENAGGNPPVGSR